MIRHGYAQALAASTTRPTCREAAITLDGCLWATARRRSSEKAPAPVPKPTEAEKSDDPRYRSSRLFARLWTGYLSRHKGLIALAFVIMTIDGSTLGLLSWMLEPLFDTVFQPGGQGSLMLVGMAILSLFVLRAFTSITSRALIVLVSQRNASRMQTDMLAHILSMDGAFFQTHAPGSLIERVQGDTQAVQAIWVTLLTGLGRDVVSLIGLFVVALWIDPMWTLSALIGAPLLILPAAALQRYLRRKSRQVRAQAGLRATRLDEIFHGIQAVKLNRMESYQTARFERILKIIVRAEVRASTGRAVMPAMVDIVTGIGFFAVLLLGGSEVAAGNRTVGEFMSFFTAMALTFQPLRRLGDLAGTWQIAAASLERIFRMFDMAPRISRPATSAAMPAPGAPDIVLDDVHFAYPGVPVLNGVSFTAKAGQMTAIVGPSGAGKTTVFHLLTGLLDPDTGQVRIGGVDARGLALNDQRGLFASVTQEAALFDETLRENITLGRAGVDEGRLAAVLDAARLTDLVASLPDGINTAVGPRGSALSGGQRQRVAIARALLHDAPVLLLDEATSALDAQSEALVSDALARLATGRTTLVIAHRLATVREADHIVVLDQGQVAEQGRHDDLLAKGGLYAQLYRLQFKD